MPDTVFSLDLGFLYLGDEPIATARESLDETRGGGRVTQSFADFVKSCSEATFEVHKGAVGPEPGLELLTRDHLTRTFQ